MKTLIALTLAALALPAVAADYSHLTALTSAGPEDSALFGTPLDPIRVEFDASQDGYSFALGFDLSALVASRTVAAATADEYQGEALGWLQRPAAGHWSRNVLRYAAGLATTAIGYLLYDEFVADDDGSEPSVGPDTLKLRGVEEVRVLGPNPFTSVDARDVRYLRIDNSIGTREWPLPVGGSK